MDGNFEAINIFKYREEEDDAVGGLSYDGQRMLIYKVEHEPADVFESKSKWYQMGDS